MAAPAISLIALAAEAAAELAYAAFLALATLFAGKEAVDMATEIQEMVAADEEAEAREGGSSSPCLTCGAADTTGEDEGRTPPPAPPLPGDGGAPTDAEILEQQRKKKAEIEASCAEHKEKTNVVNHQHRPGGYTQAEKDFDDLQLDNVKDIETTDYGRGKPTTGRTGTMKDGTEVKVRPDSESGHPTLEFQTPKSRIKSDKKLGLPRTKGSKVRYN